VEFTIASALDRQQRAEGEPGSAREAALRCACGDLAGDAAVPHLLDEWIHDQQAGPPKAVEEHVEVLWRRHLPRLPVEQDPAAFQDREHGIA
jgi:hypothetical protein